MNRLRGSAMQIAKHETRSTLIKNIPRYLVELLVVSFVIVLVMVSLLSEQEPKNIVPTIAVFGVAALRLLPSTNVFARGIADLRVSRHTVSLLYSDLRPTDKLELPRREVIVDRTEFKTLQLESVSFAFGDINRPILSDINLDISQGDAIGIVGPSGAGKTTLLNILLGLLEPDTGTIVLNGQKLSQHLAQWHTNIAVIPQETFLLDDSIRANVAFGIEDGMINSDLVWQSLRQAKLDGFVSTLPQGIDSIAGERGAFLSGGQRQRIALARSFYHRRTVLVMDEATSSLDQNTEDQIVDELGQLKGVKTIIVIAHRDSALRYCDRIYRIEDGRIVSCSGGA